MRLLFEIDKKNYDPNGKKFSRPSVRGIIIRSGKIALVHSLKYDYYKFPGGGINGGETHMETLIREVAEETGLTVIADSVREYGYVYRIQKGKREDIFIQHNFYYFCDIEDNVSEVRLDAYEEEEQFTLEFVTPQTAINVNTIHDHGIKNNSEAFCVMNERDTRVLEMLSKELNL